MESMHPGLFLIINKFPKHVNRIDALFKNDPDFKDLCSDYFLCINTLHKYRNGIREDQGAIKEYDMSARI